MAGDGIVTFVKVARGALRLRLALTRCSTGALVAAVLVLVAAGLWFALLPSMSAQVDRQARAVALARSAPLPKPVVSAPVLASERLTAFYAALGDGAHTERVVINLFGAASDAGVVLDKAEYKPAHDFGGRFDTYTITLPVKGDYSSLRRFSEKVLVSVPYASLDDMRFKRNSASDPAVEANLRFTAFLRPSVLTKVEVPIPASASAETTATMASEPVVASAASASATAISTSTSAPPMSSVTTAASASGSSAPAIAAYTSAPSMSSLALAASPASPSSSTARVAAASTSSVGAGGTLPKPASGTTTTSPTVPPRASTSIPMPTLPLPVSFASTRVSTGEVRR